MNRITLPLIALFMGTALSVSAAAQPAAEGDARASVEAMLGGFESAASDEEWQTLGAVAVPHLLAIAVDESVPRSTRARAVAALGNFPTAESVALLTGLLAPGGDSVLQRKALRALARTAGDAHTPLIAGYLESEDTVLREAAAHALGIVGTGAARNALLARREVETSTAVQKAIDEELAR